MLEYTGCLFANVWLVIRISRTREFNSTSELPKASLSARHYGQIRHFSLSFVWLTRRFNIHVCCSNATCKQTHIVNIECEKKEAVKSKLCASFFHSASCEFFYIVIANIFRDPASLSVLPPQCSHQYGSLRKTESLRPRNAKSPRRVLVRDMRLTNASKCVIKW